MLFYPAIYYLHSLFILPLLATSDQDRRWCWVGLILLGMSFSQYFSYLPRDTKFLEWSYGILIGYAMILIVQIWTAMRADPPAGRSSDEPTREEGAALPVTGD